MNMVKEFLFPSKHKEAENPTAVFDHMVYAENWYDALRFLATQRIEEKVPPEEQAKLADGQLGVMIMCLMHDYSHRKYVCNELMEGATVAAGTVFINKARTLSA